MVAPEESVLRLPILPAHGEADLGTPEDTAAVAITRVTESEQRQVITRDLASGTSRLVSEPDFLGGRVRLDELGLETEDWGENVYEIRDDDPLSAQVQCRRRGALGRSGWDVRVEATATMRATAIEFFVDTELTAFEGDDEIARRYFQTRVRRCD
jgi:hypothetical protein